MNGSRKLRPLVALAMVALIGAGCSKEPAENGSGSNKNAPYRQAIRFADCMRENGVKAFPDPDASRGLTIDAVVNGSSLETSGSAWKEAIAACRDLQPPGFTGTEVSSKQQDVRLKFAQCMRDNGIEDFPDPTRDGPLLDTTRMPGQPGAHSIPGFDATVHKCGQVYSGELGIR
jgi:hypothetical protein